MKDFEGIEEIVGSGRTMTAAYEDFATEVAHRIGPEDLTGAELEKFFLEHPIPTRVEIVVEPHDPSLLSPRTTMSEWVRHYNVKSA